MKKLLFLILLLPNLVFAKVLMVGGDNIGIGINTSGVYVSGFYKVDGKYLARDNGFLVGDRIIGVNDNVVNSISDIKNLIVGKNVNFKVIRGGEVTFINYELSDKLLTGILVRDSVNGIGTLTYVDPMDLSFGALGHDISDDEGNIFKIKSGNVFKSNVVGVSKGNGRIVGEINSSIDYSTILGSISDNNECGIFGKLDSFFGPFMETMDLDLVKEGEASIISDVNGVKDSYSIEIVSIDRKSKTRNFKIKVVDPRLINITGGIVRGMSGSPIIQDGKIIGAVTHTVINIPNYGFGISIDNMIEE